MHEQEINKLIIHPKGNLPDGLSTKKMYKYPAHQPDRGLAWPGNDSNYNHKPGFFVIYASVQ